jgi:hypothetical protein
MRQSDLNAASQGSIRRHDAWKRPIARMENGMNRMIKKSALAGRRQ